MYVVGTIEPQRTGRRSRRDNRTAILNAARVAFARRGLAGVTFDEIAHDTGLTRRTIYNHFANVDDLFAGSVRFALDRLGRALPALAPCDAPLAEALERHLADLLTFFASDAYGEVYMAVVRHGGAHPMLKRSFHAQVMVPIRTRLVAALGGSHRADIVQRVAGDMIALTLGLAESGRLLNRKPEEAAQHLGPLVAAFAHLLAQPEPHALDRVA